MDEFLLSVADAPYAFFAILAVALVAYYQGAKRATMGLADPWMAQQLLTACASTAVFFLWWIGKITVGTACYHAAATALFYAITLYRPPLQRAQWQSRARRRFAWRLTAEHTSRLQVAAFATLLVTQAILWAITGLPVLLASRLDAAATGGGIGILTRITSVLIPVVIFLTVVRIGQRKAGYRLAQDVAILLSILAIQVANGSKSNIFYTVFFFFTFDWIARIVSANHKRIDVSGRTVAVALVLVFALALVPLALENIFFTSSLSENTLLQFVSRIVLSGDSYVYFYGDNFFAQITRMSPTLLLAGDLLGTLRLIPREALPVHPGVQVYRELFPYSDSIKGPNMRLDLYGMLYGGWIQGLLFTALCAALFNWMRSAIFRARSATMVMIAAHLFISAPTIFIDPTLASVALLNAVVCFPLLAGLVTLTRARRRHSSGTGPSLEHKLKPGSVS